MESVYIVEMDVAWEGTELLSVHKTLSGANDKALLMAKEDRRYSAEKLLSETSSNGTMIYRVENVFYSIRISTLEE